MPMGPDAPLAAMMQGFQQGNQQAQAIMPNAYQPMGKAAAKNPYQGSFDMLTNQVMQIAYELKNQGDEHRDCVEKLYKIAYDLSKVSNELTDRIEEGEDESAGY